MDKKVAHKKGAKIYCIEELTLLILYTQQDVFLDIRDSVMTGCF